MKYTPENSAVAAQLAAHQHKVGGWDKSQEIAQTIENQDPFALNILTSDLTDDAKRIIDSHLAPSKKNPY